MLHTFDKTQIFDSSRTMEIYEVLEAFSSLSQETRLRVFKLLVEYGSEGLLPGKIANVLKIPDNTLSFHLSHMSKAKLVTSKKEGRSITYFANIELVEELIEYLQQNCCARQKTKSKSKASKEQCC